MGILDINTVTIIDFETSGLSGRDDRVIEMAAMRVSGGKVTAEFSTLVKIPFPVPEKSTEITGITSEDLAEAMDEETAFRILNRMIADSVIVAHNAAFDMGFLNGALTRLAGRTFKNDFLDTLTIARKRLPYPHTLNDVSKMLGVTLDGAHRALNDVRACYDVLVKLDEQEPIDEFLNVLGYKAKHGKPAWFPEWAKLITV